MACPFIAGEVETKTSCCVPLVPVDKRTPGGGDWVPTFPGNRIAGVVAEGENEKLVLGMDACGDD